MGEFHFSVTVTDANGSASAPLSMSVGYPASHMVYFVGSDHAIHLWLWGAHGWDNQTLGGAVAAGTRPTGYENGRGNDLVYYVGSDHAIHLWLYGSHGWENQTLGGAVATSTSPTAYQDGAGTPPGLRSTSAPTTRSTYGCTGTKVG